ncbi:MAG TPA: hypothetical protein VE861_07270 [Gemmatimonadaceae bacterium]|nr:hypothetical protein [Gemmatimonadaceae bacterium]
MPPTRSTTTPLAASLSAALLAMMHGGALCAQAVGTTPADSGLRLRRVEIIRHDIYDSADVRSWYGRFVNRVHVRTRRSVVEREMLLRAGDPLDSARAAETGRNLRRLQVFRDVVVDSSADGSTLRVTTRDGWTTRPYASFRSTGSQRLFSVGIVETNFLGLAATLDARYVEDPDRSLVRLAFGAPRLFRNRVSTGAFYNRLSDGHSIGAAAEQPFFSLSSRNSMRAGFVTFAGRVLRFRDGSPRAADSLDRRFTLGNVGVTHALRASPRGYVRVGADAQVRRDDFVRRTATPADIPRSITGAATGFVELSKADFLLTRNFRLMGQPEDVNLSSTIRLGVALAPRAFGYARNAAGPVIAAQTGLRIPRGFVQLSARANGLASAGAIDSGTASVQATLALQPGPRHLLVAFTSRAWDRDPFPGEEFDLGLSRGPRAFQLHAFTGDRQRYSMLEYRWIALPRVLNNFSVGLATFAETGGAWYSGTRPRDGSDAGVGLRMAPIRSAANVGATRIDLVRRFANDREPAGWLVVVGTGFTFDALR